MGKNFFYTRFQLSAHCNIIWYFILISLPVKQQGKHAGLPENFNFQGLLQITLKNSLASQAVYL